MTPEQETELIKEMQFVSKQLQDLSMKYSELKAKVVTGEITLLGKAIEPDPRAEQVDYLLKFYDCVNSWENISEDLKEVAKDCVKILMNDILKFS